MITAEEMVLDLRRFHSVVQLAKILKISASSLHRYSQGFPVKNENIYNIIKKYWENPHG